MCKNVGRTPKGDEVGGGVRLGGFEIVSEIPGGGGPPQSQILREFPGGGS